MNRTTKLILDIGMGAVLPILILTYLSETLGNIPAYILAGLIPAGWVIFDLLVLTRRFNFITSYVGAFALINSGLTFWFVDGLLYAIKDTIVFVLTVSLFAGSVLLRRPIIHYFVLQSMAPETPQQEAALKRLLRLPPVWKRLMIGTLVIAGLNFITACVNFWLNLTIVTAPFDTLQFNQQIAQVNAITRFAFTLPEVLAMGIVIYRIIYQIYHHLPQEEGKSKIESEFWDLVALWEQEQAEPPPAFTPPEPRVTS